MIGKLFRSLIYLAILATVALVAYAYIGPYFGADFSAPESEIRVPVNLNVNGSS